MTEEKLAGRSAAPGSARLEGEPGFVAPSALLSFAEVLVRDAIAAPMHASGK